RVSQECFGGCEFAGLRKLNADCGAELRVVFGSGGEALEDSVRFDGFFLMTERDAEQSRGFGLIGVSGELRAGFQLGGDGIAVLESGEGGRKVGARSGREARRAPDGQQTCDKTGPPAHSLMISAA